MLRWLLACVVCVYCTRELRDLRRVVIEVTGQGIEVVSSTHIGSRLVDLHSLHKAKYHVEEKPATVHVYYNLPNGQSLLAQSTADPRLLHGDWHSGTDITGGRILQKKGYISVTVPASAVSIKLVYPSSRKSMSRKTHEAPIPREAKFVSHPKFRNTDAAGQAELMVEHSQMVGNPEYTKNIVIVSAGYTEANKAKFLATAKKAFTFFGSGSGTLLSSPYDRYMAVMNYFVVWQASEEDGASYPLAPDGTGGKPGVGEVVIKDNLDCKYGTTVLRLLNCDYTKMTELAFATTPAYQEKTVVLALVNDVEYGGSGGQRFGSIYTGEWTTCDSSDSDCTIVELDGKQHGYKMKENNKFLRVLIHEIGHADGDLSDEYNYEFSEDQDLELKNCHYSSSKPPWEHWIGHPFGIVETPTPVCSYDNYFKPTPDRCLMNTELSNEYCPACAESMVTAFYRDFDNDNGAALAQPQCPRGPETMIVVEGDDFVIGANAQFLNGPSLSDASTLESGAHKNAPDGDPRATKDGTLPLRQDEGEIKHTWRLKDGAVLRSGKWVRTGASLVPSLPLNTADLGPPRHNPYELELVIEDKSQFTLKDELVAVMKTTAHFRVLVVSASNTTYGSVCKRSWLDSVDADEAAADTLVNECPLYDIQTIDRFYCGICDAGAVCNNTFPLLPFTAFANTEAVLENIEKVLFGVGGALLVGGFCAFLVIWLLIARHFRNDVDEVLPFPPILRYARWAMLAMAVLTMLVAVAMIVVAIFSYKEMSTLGRVLALVVIIFAALLYVIAFIGFTAAFYRSKLLLTINGVLLLCIVIALLVTSVLIFYTGNNIETETFRDPLLEQWDKQVRENPKSVCSFQAEFMCSGFTNSCHNKFNSQCPRDCTGPNKQYPNPCFDMVVERIKKNFEPVGITCIVLTIIMFIGLAINWALCCCIRRRKMVIKHKLAERPAGFDEEEGSFGNIRAAVIIRNLSPSERDSMKKQFTKIDKNKGMVDRRQLRHFYKNAFGATLTDAEVEEAMRCVPADGEGRISFIELINRFAPDELDSVERTKLINDKRIAHLDRSEVEQLLREFRRIDKDSSGVISLKELRSFYRRLYSQDPDPDDLERALKAVDNDGSGDISFFEFVQMFAGKAR